MLCARCHRDNPPEAKFCRECGNSLTAPTTSVAVSPGRSTPKTVEGKNPIGALLLSWLLPGLGQFYNGDFKKGFAILLGWLVSLPFVFGSFFVLSFVPLAISCWSGIDAYQVASKKKPLWT